jgi:hypothetical protein
MTAIMFIGLTVITMMGGDTKRMLIHCPAAVRVGVRLKYNWTPTLTNLRQRVDIKWWTSALKSYVCFVHIGSNLVEAGRKSHSPNYDALISR